MILQINKTLKQIPHERYWVCMCCVKTHLGLQNPKKKILNSILTVDQTIGLEMLHPNFQQIILTRKLLAYNMCENQSICI